jgi:hypothetical protein
MKTSNSRTPRQSIGNKSIALENLQYAGTAGISKNNRSRGFVPAFLDTDSGQVYRSRFPDGRPAPVHMLSGLPDKLFNSHGASSEQYAVKDSLISGFVLEEIFYTREAAAIALKRIH